MNIPTEMFKYLSSQRTFIQVLWVFILSLDEAWTDEGFIEKNKDKILAHYKTLNSTFSPDWQQILQAYQDGVAWYNLYLQHENKKTRADAIHVLMKLNELAETQYAMTGKKAESNIRLVTARFSEGYTKSEIFSMIEHKVKEWKGTKMEKYLRPATLFQKSKIDGYINELSIKTNGQQVNKSRFDTISELATAAKRYN
jgi:uncharacterized phage protein (TIGR02220 family)